MTIFTIANESIVIFFQENTVFTCTMCHKVCKSAGGLKNHIAPKHKSMEEETSDMDISDNSDGEICEVNKCGNGSKEITIMVLTVVAKCL